MDLTTLSDALNGIVSNSAAAYATVSGADALKAQQVGQNGQQYINGQMGGAAGGFNPTMLLMLGGVVLVVLFMAK